MNYIRQPIFPEVPAARWTAVTGASVVAGCPFDVVARFKPDGAAPPRARPNRQSDTLMAEAEALDAFATKAKSNLQLQPSRLY